MPPQGYGTLQWRTMGNLHQTSPVRGSTKPATPTVPSSFQQKSDFPRRVMNSAFPFPPLRPAKRQYIDIFIAEVKKTKTGSSITWSGQERHCFQYGAENPRASRAAWLSIQRTWGKLRHHPSFGIHLSGAQYAFVGIRRACEATCGADWDCQSTTALDLVIVPSGEETQNGKDPHNNRPGHV